MYLRVYPRLRLDVSYRDLLFGVSACGWAWRRRKLERDALRAGSGEDGGLVCLSVRSGFDLLLRALALPAGSEVLVSAVTHPDMVRILDRHSLRAIPVDLDPATLNLQVGALEQAVTPRTRAVLIAHLFGGRMNLGPAVNLAERHGLLLLEDCAHAFRGPRDPGDPRADVSMFSFGPLKTATALGGALLYVRDPELLRRMREIQESWPVQHRVEYLARLLKFLGFRSLAHPLAYGLLVRLCELLGQDLDAGVNGSARSFAKKSSGEDNEEFFSSIRHRPSAPLLALLARRLSNFDAARLDRRRRAGERVSGLISPHVSHPGRGASGHTHWLLPVVVPNPEATISTLRSRGFDATRTTSNIAVVEPPGCRPGLHPNKAARMMKNLVFLPVYPEMSEEDPDRLAAVVVKTTNFGAPTA